MVLCIRINFVFCRVRESFLGPEHNDLQVGILAYKVITPLRYKIGRSSEQKRLCVE